MTQSDIQDDAKKILPGLEDCLTEFAAKVEKTWMQHRLRYTDNGYNRQQEDNGHVKALEAYEDIRAVTDAIRIIVDHGLPDGKESHLTSPLIGAILRNNKESTLGPVKEFAKKYGQQLLNAHQTLSLTAAAKSRNNGWRTIVNQPSGWELD